MGDARERLPLQRRALLRWGVGTTVAGAAAVAGVVGVGAEEAVAGGPSRRSALPGTGSGRLAAEVVFRGPSSRRAVALTFDDGPTERWTPSVLELLRRHSVRATFFVVGSRAARLPDLVRQQLDDGHQVGNHSWDHVDLVTHSPAVVGRQLRTTDTLLRGMTGGVVSSMRPPWGHVDPPGLLAASDLGYRVVLWSHLVRGSRPRQDVDATLATIGAGAIVLAHDGGPTPTGELYLQLDRLLTALLADGYDFVTVDELLAAADASPAPARPAPLA